MNKSDIFFSVVTYGHKILDLEPLLDSINDFWKERGHVYLCLHENKSRYGYILEEEHFCKYGVPTMYSRTENIGYGRANNLNFAKTSESKGMLFIVCNPDISFTLAGIREIDSVIKKMANENIACLAPLIMLNNGEVQYTAKRNPTVLSLVVGRIAWLTRIWIFERYDDWHKHKDNDYKEAIFEAPYLSGCFLIIKEQYYRQIAGFDRRIFLHLEDADLVRRLHQIGKTLHCPKLVVRHGWARGSHNSVRQTISLCKSTVYYFYKHGLRIW